MKRNLLFAMLLLGLTTIGCAKSGDSRTKLWYDYPADEFIESLVMGNGQMGAIIYGGVEQELINLNEMTLWSGEPVKSSVDAKEQKRNLAEIRKALAVDDYHKADKLQSRMQGNFSQVYLPMASLNINFNAECATTNYRRELDLTKATTIVNYTLGKTNYTRTYFVSHPDKVMAVELVAKGREKIDAELS